jgi:hypothetical protein
MGKVLVSLALGCLIGILSCLQVFGSLASYQSHSGSNRQARDSTRAQKTFANALSAGPYSNLRLATLSETRLYRVNVGRVLDSCVNNQWFYFEEMLEWNLGPLRILRELNLQFADLNPLYKSNSSWWRVTVLWCGYDNDEAKPVFKKLERIRRRFLKKLAEELLKPRSTNMTSVSAGIAEQ